MIDLREFLKELNGARFVHVVDVKKDPIIFIWDGGPFVERFEYVKKGLIKRIESFPIGKPETFPMAKQAILNYSEKRLNI